jgi:hypothetical protein
MKPARSRSTPWFTVLFLLSVPLMFAGSPAVAAKPAAKAAAAKKHKPAAASAKSGGSGEDAAKKASPPAAPYETPTPAPTESPLGTPPASSGTATSIDTSTSTSTSTSTTTDTATATVTATEVAKEPEKPEEPRPLAETPGPPPPPAEPIPATVVTSQEAPAVETPAPYVEHLGPKSFPGRLRGLYAGSLWLEPSFNGLQWPFMARTGVGVSGAFWVDSGYELIVRDDKNKTLPGTRMAFQQGRGVLRLTPAYVHGRFFIQGQAELVANQCQATTDVCTSGGTFSTDDLWIRVGEWNKWDIKVGRFEAWEIYHLGMGLDMYTLERAGALQYGVINMQNPGNPVNLDAPSFYGVNYLHDRPSDGLGVGYAALHAYATEALRFELLGELGVDNVCKSPSTTSSTSANVEGNNAICADNTKTAHTYGGARPAAIYDLGWMKLKVGLEYQLRTAAVQTNSPSTGEKQDSSYKRTRYGAGLSLQFVVDPIIEFGVNAAYGKQSETDEGGNDLCKDVANYCYSTLSLGGFANMRLANLWLAGVGANWTTQTDSHQASGSATADYTAHLQGFAALQYLVAGQLFVKLVVGFARADFQPSDLKVSVWSNYMYSGRIRLMYLY